MSRLGIAEPGSGNPEEAGSVGERIYAAPVSHVPGGRAARARPPAEGARGGKVHK